MTEQTVVIIGAGPAGLTAALELVRRPGFRPVVLEAGGDVGGLSRTVEHRGNRLDIGGHRFFSKSDRVMDWWFDILPLQRLDDHSAEGVEVSCQGQRRYAPVRSDAPDPEVDDDVLLVRRRTSRILHHGRLYDYPVTLGLDTLRKLGLARATRIACSHLRSTLWPVRPEVTLEDFFVNRFGRELYRTFFRDYTEKVWGVPCHEMPADWGAQRVKGLSTSRAVLHALRTALGGDRSLAQRSTETSLIERFLYPKYGPGQMWRAVRRRVESGGGEVRLRHHVSQLRTEGGRVTTVSGENHLTGEPFTLHADWVLSSMPIPRLVRGLEPAAPAAVAGVAADLRYRDFLTVGLLLDRLRPLPGSDQSPPSYLLPDTWIYVQEPAVRLGRIQVFNNWSPYMVRDPTTVWLGLEYFCAEGDALWRRPDSEVARLAVAELEQIGLADPAAARDAVVVRQPRAYPAYTGSYHRFDEVREYLSSFANLLPIGRNGMHTYNNQDHSMLAAMKAVEILTECDGDRASLWRVNSELEYHEEIRAP